VRLTSGAQSGRRRYQVCLLLRSSSRAGPSPRGAAGPGAPFPAVEARTEAGT
jgi:hypothetical protein